NADEIAFQLVINGELEFPLTVAVSGLDGATVNNVTIDETGTYNVTISNLQAVEMGSYSPKLLLQTSFGEEYEVDLKVIISNCADVSEIAQTQISVYPNPAESQLMIVANQP